jgi:hypothetical protein
LNSLELLGPRDSANKSRPQSAGLSPPTPATARRDFVSLYAPVDVPQHHRNGSPALSLYIIRDMPTLLPRKITQAASVFPACDNGLPLVSTGSASSVEVNEATRRFAFVTAGCFANWELTTPCCQDAAPLSYRGVRTTPRTGLNPHDIKLLLRTDTPHISRKYGSVRGVSVVVIWGSVPSCSSC